jgi:hypothetical protein
MLNSKPNNNKYHQGNFIPENKEKVLKLNSQGGIYYRSSYELRFMKFLDRNKSVKVWGSECITIPYQLTHYEKNGDISIKTHNYYPDFYYEIYQKDGAIKKVIAEVKPHSEYSDVILLEEKKFKVPDNPSLKKLKNIEYRLKTSQKNSEKWKTMIKFCDKKGWDFIVITEDILKKLGLL